MNKMTNKNEVEMPLSYWFELCKNNIYKYAALQMSQSGIPVDLQPTIIECVLSNFRKDAIDQMINSNAIAPIVATITLRIGLAFLNLAATIMIAMPRTRMTRR